MDLLHANISGARLHGSAPDETNCFRNTHGSMSDETGSNADLSFATGSDVSFCCSPRTYRDVISSTMTQSLGGGCVPFQISGRRCCSTSTIGNESTDSSPTSVRSLGIFNHCSCFMVTDLVPFSRLDRSESVHSAGTISGESGCLCSISGPNINKNCRKHSKLELDSSTSGRQWKNFVLTRHSNSCHNRQLYSIGALLLLVGAASLITNIIGIILRTSWSFTATGIWTGLVILFTGWLSICTAQHKILRGCHRCIGGTSFAALLCSCTQMAFGVVGLTVKDFHFDPDWEVPQGSREINAIMTSFGLVEVLLCVWLLVLSCCSA